MADVTRIPDDEAPTTSTAGGFPDKIIEKLRLKIPGYKLQSEISRGGQAIV